MRNDEVDGRPLGLRNTIPAAPAAPRTSPPPKEEPAPTSERPSQRGRRQPVAIDEVQWKRWTSRGAVGVRPRVVDVSRVDRAPIDPRDAFVLQLIEGGSGTMTESELADVSGFAEEEVTAIVARLVRLGIVKT